MQRDDGTGNFQQNDPEHQSLIDAVIAEINSIFANMADPHSTSCYTGTDFIPDTKIRFVVNKIYKKDSYGWDNSHDNRSNYMCPNVSNWYLNYMDNIINNDPTIPRGINVYFTENYNNYFNLVVNQTTTTYNGYTIYCSQFPSFSDFLRTSKIHVPDLFSKFWWMKNLGPSNFNQPWDPIMKGWFISSTAKGIAHEIGHSLWLYHDCPYYTSGSCTESLMNPSDKNRNYLPPTEIGRMFAALSLSNVRQFVMEDTYNQNPLNINSATLWDYEVRSYRNININAGGELTFSCHLTMPYQGLITVNSGGKLVINNANVNSILTTWGGIVVENGGYLELNSTTISDFNITIKDGGTLHISKASITGKNSIDVESSGYICIDNTAIVNLQDALSVINLHNGYKFGVNSTYVTNLGSCISSISTFPIIGNGSINTYIGDLYFQNQKFTLADYFTGNNIFIGSNIIPASVPQGPVVISSGANIIFDASQDVVIKPEFEAQSGSSFELK